jgi:hypothetical protein
MAEGNIGSGAGTIYVKNNGTINGDVYAENLDQTKNNISAETIITPADVVTKNNASYSGTLWAGGNITIGANSNIGESVLTSGTKPGSAGSITFGGGGVVGEDVKAKGTVTLNGQTVNGSVSQNDPNVPAPPNLIKPTFAWNATNYSPAPVQNTAANINTALNTNKNALSGTYYNNSGSSSAITVPDNAKVTGNLTIVSTGRVILGNSLTAIGGPWTVVIIAQSPAADAIDVAKAFTASSGIHLLLYAIGGVDMKNNMSLTGAIYANQIDAKNTFGIGRSTVLAQATLPGFTWDFSSSSVFSAVPTLWREVAPGAPPA